jgi:hypothetical protein
VNEQPETSLTKAGCARHEAVATALSYFKELEPALLDFARDRLDESIPHEARGARRRAATEELKR